MRIQEELSTRLRMERAKRGLTVHEAAGEMGIAGHTLSALERGIQKPRIPTLSKIAKVYGWPIEELIGEEATNAGKGKAPDSGAEVVYVEREPLSEVELEKMREMEAADAAETERIKAARETVESEDLPVLDEGSGLVSVRAVDDKKLEFVLIAVRDGHLTIPEAKALLKRTAAAPR